MKYCTLIIMLFTGFVTYGQSQIQVMSYNVLNYPLGDMPDRQDTLAIILNHVQPDLLLLQELKAEFGLNEIESICDDMNAAEYDASSFVIQQSNPNSSNKLQQAVVFNTEIFALDDEDVIITPHRDVNYIRLYLQDEELENGADTTFLHLFVTHLKSSQGSENEQLRLDMVNDFLPFLNDLEADDLVIFAGDFNVYESAEPAYQALLNPANSPALLDPIDMPGNWHSSSYPDKSILTQSTRENSIWGDGAGGGCDDRFDFILCSPSLLDNTSNLHYTEETYAAFGNSGSCYNQDILDCDDNGLPSTVTSALYYLSDHLPVIMQLETSFSLTTTDLPSENHLDLSWNGTELQISLLEKTSSLDLSIYDLNGRLVKSESIILSGSDYNVDLSNLSTGLYIVSVIDEEGSQSTIRIVK